MGCVDLLASAKSIRHLRHQWPISPSCSPCVMHQWNELPVLSLILSAAELRSPHLAGASEEGDSPKTWGADWSTRRMVIHHHAPQPRLNLGPSHTKKSSWKAQWSDQPGLSTFCSPQGRSWLAGLCRRSRGLQAVDYQEEQQF